MICRSCKGGGRVTLSTGKQSICPSCAGAGQIAGPREVEDVKPEPSVDFDYRRAQAKAMALQSIENGDDAGAVLGLLERVGLDASSRASLLQEIVDDMRGGAPVEVFEQDASPEPYEQQFPDSPAEAFIAEPMSESGSVEQLVPRERHPEPLTPYRGPAALDPAQVPYIPASMRDMGKRASEATDRLEEALASGNPLDPDEMDRCIAIVYADGMRTRRSGSRVQAANNLRRVLADMHRRAVKAKQASAPESMKDAVRGNGHAG